MLEPIFNGNMRIKYSVGNGGLLDHLPILFKMEKKDWKPPSPLKFNCTWLLDSQSVDLISNTWKPFDNQDRDFAMK